MQCSLQKLLAISVLAMVCFQFIGQWYKILTIGTSDLDHILAEDDQLYEWLTIQNYLNVKEFSKEMMVFSHTVTLEISEEI